MKWERRRARYVLDEAEDRMSVAAGRELVMDDAWSRPGGEDVACAAAPPTNLPRTKAMLARRARPELRA